MLSVAAISHLDAALGVENKVADCRPGSFGRGEL
jgi:hypothetical protein